MDVTFQNSAVIYSAIDTRCKGQEIELWKICGKLFTIFSTERRQLSWRWLFVWQVRVSRHGLDHLIAPVFLSEFLRVR